MDNLFSKILPYTQLHSQYDTFRMDPHSHHTMEFLYVVRGAVDLKMGEEGKSTDFAIKSNQFILILPYKRHVYEIKSPTEIIVLELGHPNPTIPIHQWLLAAEYSKRFSFAAKLLQAPQGYLLFDDTQNVRGALARIVSLVYRHGHNIHNEYFDVEYEIALLDLMVKICRCNQLLVDNILANRHVYYTLLYIAEHYAKKVTISQIAQYVGVSASYLQRIFKKSYGETVLSLLTKQRILAATNLLKNTELSVSDIAEKVGYPDRRAFFSAFKKIRGVSPSDYRHDNRNAGFVFYRDYRDPQFTADMTSHTDEFSIDTLITDTD